MPINTELSIIADVLREDGLTVHTNDEIDDGVTLEFGDNIVGLLLERLVEDLEYTEDSDQYNQYDNSEEYIVHLHISTEIYVPDTAAPELLVATNFINQEAKYGVLFLDTVDPQELDSAELVEMAKLHSDITNNSEKPFMVLELQARATVFLTSLASQEIDRLSEHVQRFADEVYNNIEEHFISSEGSHSLSA